MSDNLFQKAIIITDAHFGRQGGSPVANLDNIAFLEWAIDRAKSWGATICVFMGDWFHNRHSIDLSTLHMGLRGMEMLDSNFNKVYFLLGNHDLYKKETRDISSVSFARHLKNIRLISDPIEIGNALLLPWLVGTEAESIVGLKNRYVFSHLELPSFIDNQQEEIPDHVKLVQPDQLIGPEFVFSGHFHKRQNKTIGSGKSIGKGNYKNGKTDIIYTGALCPFDFSDRDDNRGIMLLEWGKDPIFEAWPEQPTFRYFKLSQLLESPEKLLKPKMTIKLVTDVDLEHEEIQELRQILISTYGLRRIELESLPIASVEKQEFETDTVYQTVDQTVVEGLLSVDSNGLSPAKLVELFEKAKLMAK